jgi:predicted lipoprotein
VCTNITTTTANKQEHNQQKFTALYCSCFCPHIMIICIWAAEVTYFTNHKASPCCFFLYSFSFRIKILSSYIRRMEKISWTNHVRNEEVLLRVNE